MYYQWNTEDNKDVFWNNFSAQFGEELGEVLRVR